MRNGRRGVPPEGQRKDPVVASLQEYELIASAISTTWRDLIVDTPAAVRAGVAMASREHARRVAERFYEHMLAQAGSAPYLDHELVGQRLRREMERWIAGLFTETDDAGLDARIAQQVAIGTVHARIRLPVELMVLGSHVLGEELVATLPAHFANDLERAVATHYLLALMTLATGMILSAFVRETRRRTRNEEALRQAAFGHDTLFERERQRAALSEWAQRCFGALANRRRRSQLEPLGRSAFARWLDHKGALLFAEAGEWDDLLSAIRHIDGSLLPRLASDALTAESRDALTEELESRLDAIRDALGALFECAHRGEGLRSAGARLIDRRYIEAVLSHEIETHSRSGQPFVVVLARLVDSETRSALLLPAESRLTLAIEQLAVMLGEQAAPGDYLFRYTENEVLLVEVDATAQSSMQRLARLGANIDAIVRTTSGQSSLRVRFAVAEADGHPDLQRLLRRVEFAIGTDGDARAVRA